MSLSVQDVERVQAMYPDNRIELREGKLIVMAPSDMWSGEIGGQFSYLLKIWLDVHNIGRVLDASTGFRLPNGDLLAPDVAFVSRERLKQSPHTYSPVIPELIVEIKSSSDRIRALEEKIALFLRQGVQVGILIDPDKRTVSVYRVTELRTNEEGEVVLSKGTVLRNGDILTVPELFPGWEVPITSLWPQVYE